MKAVLVAVVGAFLATPAGAHSFSEHGNMTAPAPVGAGVLAQVEATAPGVVPNGLLYYVIYGVQEGDTFRLIADDGQEPLVVGTASTCPGPDTFEPTDPDWWLNDFWVTCRNVPDFEIWFACDGQARQSDTQGVVPCDGDAIVFMAFGDVGEGFSYSEE